MIRHRGYHNYQVNDEYMQKKKAGTYSVGKDVVGKKAIFKLTNRTQKPVHFTVLVKDYKVAYGKPSFLIEPVEGEGDMWATNVKLA